MHFNDSNSLIKDIQASLKTDVAIVAIDGRSGSGKTTFARKLKTVFTNAELIHLDECDLYEDNNIESFLQDKLIPLKKTANRICIIEGVFALRKQFRDYYNYTIWIEIDKHIGY